MLYIFLSLLLIPLKMSGMDYIKSTIYTCYTFLPRVRERIEEQRIKDEKQQIKNLTAYRKKWNKISKEKKSELYTTLEKKLASDSCTLKKDHNHINFHKKNQEVFAEQESDNLPFNEIESVQYLANHTTIHKKLLPTLYDFKPTNFIERLKAYWWPAWWYQQQVKRNNKFWYHKYSLEMTIFECEQKIKLLKKTMSEKDLQINSNSEKSLALNQLNTKLSSIVSLYQDLIIQKKPNDNINQKNIYLYLDNPGSFFNNWINKESSKKGRLIENKKDIIFFTKIFYGVPVEF